jgi:hypothetical protein
MARNNSIEQRRAEREKYRILRSSIAVNEVKEAIVNELLPKIRLNRAQFEQMGNPQKLFLIQKHLGTEKSNLYEAEIIKDNGLNSVVTQDSFSRTFVYINESTDIFVSLSDKLNKTMYGVYNKDTRLFLLLESYRSMMKHIGEETVASHVLSNITIPSTSILIKVESLNGYEVSMNISEIKEMLDSNASLFIGSTSSNSTILTESLALALLDIRDDVNAASIIYNFDNQPTYQVLEGNIVGEDDWLLDDGFVKTKGGLSCNLSKASEARMFSLGNLDTSATYIVDINISKYDEGSLSVFFGGAIIHNVLEGSRGKLSYSVSPGTSSHTTLVFQSANFKGTISDISIRKIIS